MALNTISVAKVCQVIVENILQEGGQAVCLAVVDSNGALLYFYRMNNAPERLINISIGKAYTSARMRMTTAMFRDRLINESLSLFDFLDNKFTSLPGGSPLFYEQELIGGVGVSGQSLEGDVLICQQFAERIQITL